MKTEVDDSLLLDVLKTASTPVYVYNLDTLRSRIGELKNAFGVPDFALLFATMANDRDEILHVVSDNGLGACVNSLHHLEKALNAKIPKDMIQFTSTGLSKDVLQSIYGHGIALNLDSIHQAEYWFGEIGAKCGGMRINAAALLNLPEDQGDRIGNDPAELPAFIELAKARGGKMNGLHIYMGTNFQSEAEMRPALERFFQLARQVPDLEYVNIGGGIGVDYLHTDKGFNVQNYGAMVSGFMERLHKDIGRDVRLLFEPGRGLVANSGVFVTSVTDVKRLRGQRYVGVNASISVFPRPFHHPDSPHFVRHLGSKSVECTEPATVVGSTTFSRDILASCLLPAEIEVGDLLLFEDAGAYCNSMASRFLGQQEPESIFID